ncbi:MAG: stage III sporulation protein AB [Firmicutes bacterium]|nr:stage III sporulation protein AB [Bacillota bacterium]
MLKLVGLLCMIAGLGLSGILKAEELKSRIRLLEDAQYMLLNLKSQMCYFREPLQILLEKIAKTADSRAFLMLNECALELSDKSGDIGQIWTENTVRTYGRTSLTQEDMDIIVQVGTYLGQTDFAGHQIQFECTEERLRQQIHQARETERLKSPMYRKIGFIGGAAIALIIL